MDVTKFIDLVQFIAGLILGIWNKFVNWINFDFKFLCVNQMVSIKIALVWALGWNSQQIPHWFDVK